MDTKFNFNSQVCTSRSQSERLLALGLKKETADMIYPSYTDMKSGKLLKVSDTPVVIYQLQSCYDIPAWSLHRIMSMVYSSRAKKNGLGLAIIEYDNPFEDMIRQIEWLIKEGYFNKEYLNEDI